MHVFMHVSFVGMCIVIIQGTREKLAQEERASYQPINGCAQRFELTQHTTHLDMVRSKSNNPLES